MRTVKKYRVNIPAGVSEGSRVRLAGKGEPGRNGGPAGDLYVITRVSESPVFKRKGDNLEVEVPLTIPEAIRGAEVEVPTLTGARSCASRPGPSTAPSSACAARARRSSAARATGDIHYRFVIDVPASLSDEQSEAVEKLSQVMNGDPRARLFARLEACHGARRTTTRVIGRRSERGVFMISVAAELAEMHPQTLRMYETRGLIEPKRSPKGTRLYSQEDVERLRRIQEMTTELGLNLAGVERVLELEEQLERARGASRRSSAARPRCAPRWRPRSSACAGRSGPSSSPTGARRPRARARRRPSRRAASHPGAARGVGTRGPSV